MPRLQATGALARHDSGSGASVNESVACVPYQRPTVASRGDIRFNPFDALEAMACLPTLAFGAWHRLQYHAWLRGVLPTGIRDLAGIAGVTPRTFEKMLPVLEPLFDRDDQGRLRVYAMEAQRGDLPVAPPVKVRTVDPKVSDARSRAGEAGAKSRWSKRGLKVIEGDVSGSEVDGSMANGMANASTFANADAGQADASAASPMANGMATPSGSHGPSDGLLISDSKEKIEDTDGRTDVARASATDGKPDGTFATNPVAEPAAAVANGDGKSTSLGAAAMEASMAKVDGKPVPAAMEQRGPGVAEILAVLEAAGAGKIPDVLLTPSAIEPVRQLMSEGCDLQRDIVPAVRGFTSGLREPLKTWKAQAIRDAAVRARDKSRREGIPPATSPSMIRLKPGTPQYEAWLAHNGRRSFPGGPDGWYFVSEWPPGHGPTESGRPISAAQAPSSG